MNDAQSASASTITEVAAMTGRNRTTIHRWLERAAYCAPSKCPAASAWCRRPRLSAWSAGSGDE